MTTHPGSGDESLHRRDYQPEWLGRLAEDVTMEASVLKGIVHGPAAVREILTVARSLFLTPAAVLSLLGTEATS